MRYPASEKLEIIHLVEQSHLPARRTLEKLGIQPARFYRWYDRLQTGGPEALEDKSPRCPGSWAFPIKINIISAYVQIRRRHACNYVRDYFQTHISD